MEMCTRELMILSYAFPPQAQLALRDVMKEDAAARFDAAARRGIADHALVAGHAAHDSRLLHAPHKIVAFQIRIGHRQLHRIHPGA